ncbi:hypothetical protein UNSW1_1322 [Campylobacter concisus UNSW1]|nr:hypothetical protein UNSW1_1322 [Campylobacter concisus UNSW1]
MKVLAFYKNKTLLSRNATTKVAKIGKFAGKMTCKFKSVFAF